MPHGGQSSRAMAGPGSDAALQLLFGRAFLVELRRGDLESAKVFARAFLLHGMATSAEPITVFARARAASR